MQQRRSNIPTILDNFDFPAMTPNCVDRTDSTVATQALHLMNNGMVDELAGSLAKGVEGRRRRSQQQVEKLYWLALSRPPDDEERKLTMEAWPNFRWQALSYDVEFGGILIHRLRRMHDHV